MRGIFGIVGLLVTLAIVGLVVQKQLQTSTAMPTVPAVSTVPAVAGASTPTVNPAANVQQQSQQMQQQYKQAVEGAMQPPPRPEPDADKRIHTGRHCAGRSRSACG